MSFTGGGKGPQRCQHFVGCRNTIYGKKQLFCKVCEKRCIACNVPNAPIYVPKCQCWICPKCHGCTPEEVKAYEDELSQKREEERMKGIR